MATHKRSASRILVSFPAVFPKTTWNARLGRCIYSAAIKAVRAAPAPPPPSLTDRARARGAGKGQCEPSPSPPALHQAGRREHRPSLPSSSLRLPGGRGSHFVVIDSVLLSYVNVDLVVISLCTACPEEVWLLIRSYFTECQRRDVFPWLETFFFFPARTESLYDCALLWRCRRFIKLGVARVYFMHSLIFYVLSSFLPQAVGITQLLFIPNVFFISALIPSFYFLLTTILFQSALIIL